MASPREKAPRKSTGSRMTVERRDGRRTVSLCSGRDRTPIRWVRRRSEPGTGVCRHAARSMVLVSDETSAHTRRSSSVPEHRRDLEPDLVAEPERLAWCRFTAMQRPLNLPRARTGSIVMHVNYSSI
jgi:hypothetical protein